MYICYFAIDLITFFIPISIVLVIITEMFFRYRSPGHNIIVFWRILFFLFLVIFTFLGVAISFLHVDKVGERGDMIYLWQACTSLVIALFVLVPTLKLLTAISYPVIQPEDVSCVRFSRIGLFLFVGIFLAKTIFSFLVFLGVNKMSDRITQEIHDNLRDRLSPASRAYYVTGAFVFEFVPCLLAILAVFVVRKHEIEFANDPFYAPEVSESTGHKL